MQLTFLTVQFTKGQKYFYNDLFDILDLIVSPIREKYIFPLGGCFCPYNPSTTSSQILIIGIIIITIYELAFADFSRFT